MNMVQAPSRAREVVLAVRPEGAIGADIFDIRTVDVPHPAAGEVLVRNEWMLLSVANVKLIRFEEDPDVPMRPYKVGGVPHALTVGTVVESAADNIKAGDLVIHPKGWREYALAGGDRFGVLPRNLFPSPEYFLTQGPTALRGIDVVNVGEGDVVYVSGAAGAVGSLAGQIARFRGAKQVIGSAGSVEKVDYLVKELGFTDAFNYRDGSTAEQLRRIAPDGITVFFDNVGGDQFEAAVEAAAPGARFALCGWVSGVHPELDVAKVIGRDITIRGFTTSYRPEDTRAWNEKFSAWVAERGFVFSRTIFHGVDSIPDAIIALANGSVKGQMLVALNEA
jgi:NADPH-dependent curcumin reductase CurA